MESNVRWAVIMQACKIDLLANKGEGANINFISYWAKCLILGLAYAFWSLTSNWMDLLLLEDTQSAEHN